MNTLKTLKFYKTLWGVNINFNEISSLVKTFNLYKSQGFEGIELASGFFDTSNKSNLMKALKEANFEIIVQIHTTGYPIIDHNHDSHFDDFKRKVENALTYEQAHINCHSGSDLFNLNQNLNFYQKCENFTKNIKNLSISHETHRQRSLNTAYTSYQILKELHHLPITLDLSHWIVSAERLLSNETDGLYWEDLLKLLEQNTQLIHLRVSSTNNIQVTDPLYEINKEYTEYFENIWKRIINNNSNQVIRITPEYGPVPYALQNKDGSTITNTDEVILNYMNKFKRTLI